MKQKKPPLSSITLKINSTIPKEQIILNLNLRQQ